MVRHRIIWTLKETLTETEKSQVKIAAKENLEALCGVISGLRSLEVVIDLLPGSNGDMMLDSLFDSEDALRFYATHPRHVFVADTYVRPYTASRACVDYEVED